MISQFSPTEFGTTFNKVISCIENPVQMWKSDNYKDKRLLMEMYFEDKVTYDYLLGFGTAELACLPKLLMMKESEKINLVEMSGIEPESNKAFL